MLGRPHGVRGALRLFLHNPSSRAVRDCGALWISDGKGRTARRELRGYRSMPRFSLVELEGVSDRDSAAALTGSRVLLPRAELGDLGEGEFYVEELKGIRAYDGERLLGAIVSSRSQGVLEVVTVRGEEMELQVPLVEDHVETLDLEARELHVRDSENLLSTPLPGGGGKRGRR
ncbi:MAG: ribosome maturation factor RimM [Polyangia bacterium]